MLQCPVCGTPMREIERFGVMIDICPSCKGVWLDRGELDKIIRYAQTGYGDEVIAAGGYEPVAYEQSSTPPPTRPTHYQQPYPQQQYPQQHQPPQQPHPKHRKRRFFEFLEDLFEFGD
ncbi:MAG: zf-TFIIB domain-containing protein [Armatimonadetes bacterium]|nr:zf-TFIIB domain-containing protein [Armatimonadota bacterium]MCX7968547.1 zf-TFIIB domain-containing protein [Armatimonadota bacterium]MDW8142178.1 zf-TFIIB domain-containing protein [Armatimonadota bacterium]